MHMKHTSNFTAVIEQLTYNDQVVEAVVITFTYTDCLDLIIAFN